MIINFQQRLHERMKAVAMNAPVVTIERQQVQAAQPKPLSDVIKKQLKECFFKMHFALADLHELNLKTIRAASDDSIKTINEMVCGELKKAPLNPAAQHLNETVQGEMRKMDENRARFPEFDMKPAWVEKLSDAQKKEEIKKAIDEFNKQKRLLENLIAGKALVAKLSPEMIKQMHLQMAAWKIQNKRSA